MLLTWGNGAETLVAVEAMIVGDVLVDAPDVELQRVAMRSLKSTLIFLKMVRNSLDLTFAIVKR